MTPKEILQEWLDGLADSAEIGVSGDCLVSTDGSLIELGYYEVPKVTTNRR
jgi:hypothetical protein